MEDMSNRLRQIERKACATFDASVVAGAVGFAAGVADACADGKG